MATDRYSRHVRHASLSVPHGAPARRLAFAVEESLRLVTLPGENEGRSYYFRRLQIRGLPPDGDRSSWFDSFQRALLAAAGAAVHATDPRAPQTAAVYFQGETEALETLLHRLIAGAPAAEWFWPAVVERELEAEGAGARSLIPQIIEQLRAREASWVAVAIAIFAAPEPLDPVRLLAAIPAATARRWVEEVAQASRPAHYLLRAPAGVGIDAQSVIARAVEAFGIEDIRTLWLATMAVIFELQGVLASGVAVAQARSLIEAYVKGSCAGREARATKNPEPGATIESDSLRVADAVRAAAPAAPASASDLSVLHPEHPQATRASAIAASPYRLEGAPTTAAGLFFSVNILDRLGLAEKAPALAIQILHRLAAQSGVPADDPIALWLSTREAPALTPQVRAWSLAVHRYIRLIPARPNEAPLTAREIVNRPGLFSANRTDLDITLPLDAVDIRIRRGGLDLDPGWLPWFGRVIRFHYE